MTLALRHRLASRRLGLVLAVITVALTALAVLLPAPAQAKLSSPDCEVVVIDHVPVENCSPATTRVDFADGTGRTSQAASNDAHDEADFRCPFGYSVTHVNVFQTGATYTVELWLLCDRY